MCVAAVVCPRHVSVQPHGSKLKAKQLQKTNPFNPTPPPPKKKNNNNNNHQVVSWGAFSCKTVFYNQLGLYKVKPKLCTKTCTHPFQGFVLFQGFANPFPRDSPCPRSLATIFQWAFPFPRNCYPFPKGVHAASFSKECGTANPFPRLCNLT